MAVFETVCRGVEPGRVLEVTTFGDLLLLDVRQGVGGDVHPGLLGVTLRHEEAWRLRDLLNAAYPQGGE